MVRVLIVGAGVTGSLCAYMLRKHLPTRLQCQIVVWEKSRGCGGRMATSRSPGNKNCIAELGAQYITQDPKYLDSHASFYNELLSNNILEPFNKKIEGLKGENMKNYISKNGLSSIAKYFFSKSTVDILNNQRLQSLRLTSEDLTSDWVVWEVATEKGAHDHFDAVIVTTPVPQTLDIDGLKGYLLEEQLKDLESVEFSSRFAIGLFYEPGKFTLDLPHIAKYVTDSESIRYYSIDHVKRGDSEENGASVIAHTSVPFGIKHLEDDKEAIGPELLNELKRLVLQLPKPNYVKYHKWKYSQVTKPTEKNYGCLTVIGKPLLQLAGDGFTHSNFDGCIESALKVEEEIVKWVGSF